MRESGKERSRKGWEKGDEARKGPRRSRNNLRRSGESTDEM
jgi:hypothetical protein